MRQCCTNSANCVVFLYYIFWVVSNEWWVDQILRAVLASVINRDHQDRMQSFHSLAMYRQHMYVDIHCKRSALISMVLAPWSLCFRLIKDAAVLHAPDTSVLKQDRASLNETYTETQINSVNSHWRWHTGRAGIGCNRRLATISLSWWYPANDSMYRLHFWSNLGAQRSGVHQCLTCCYLVKTP